MPQSASSAKFTYEDCQLFSDDGKRHELIDGEHFVTLSPVTKHQRISMNLSSHVHTYLQTTKSGEQLYAPMDVVLSDLDVIQPDLIICE